VFSAIPQARSLRTLGGCGLGYIKLGSTGPTLSGGEAQRQGVPRTVKNGPPADALP